VIVACKNAKLDIGGRILGFNNSLLFTQSKYVVAEYTC